MIAAADFKRVLSHFASGVTIVTTRDADGRPAGLTASAFTSVSLDPPLILVCIAHNAQSFPTLKASKGFTVNILSQSQETISNRFASSVSSGPEKFQGVAHRAGTLGYPVIEGARAYLECHTVHAYSGGDHTIFVGQVEAADGEAESGVEPLLYYRGKYGRLQPPGGSS